jgi:hypothetical protein
MMGLSSFDARTAYESEKNLDTSNFRMQETLCIFRRSKNMRSTPFEGMTFGDIGNLVIEDRINQASS